MTRSKLSFGFSFQNQAKNSCLSFSSTNAGKNAKGSVPDLWLHQHPGRLHYSINAHIIIPSNSLVLTVLSRWLAHGSFLGGFGTI
jgi:hypothetical protein